MAGPTASLLKCSKHMGPKKVLGKSFMEAVTPDLCLKIRRTWSVKYKSMYKVYR